jgi:hypothetical protein
MPLSNRDLNLSGRIAGLAAMTTGVVAPRERESGQT